MMRRAFALTLATSALLLAEPQTADAYIGPGAGISALGTAMALFFAILLAIVGFIWYPVKRLWARIRKTEKVDTKPSPS